MGAHAVFNLLESTDKTEPQVMCINANKILSLPLMKCVENTLEIAKAIEDKNFNKALDLRGQCVYMNDTY